MSLEPCQECGAEISTDAERCPHCDAPTKSTQALYGCGGVFGVVMLFIPVLIFVSVMVCAA